VLRSLGYNSISKLLNTQSIFVEIFEIVGPLEGIRISSYVWYFDGGDI
jgi:hypothetical protein